MAAVTEKMNLETFRARHAGQKPYFELLNGEAVQKAVPTRLHSILQFVLAVMISELGFEPRPELTLAIDNEWEPIPDVAGTLGAEEDPYPTRPIAVAIEILSPDDRFSAVVKKCRRYAAWGVGDILVFDPVDREGWYWDRATGELRAATGEYRFNSSGTQLKLAELWRRFDERLNRVQPTRQ